MHVTYQNTSADPSTRRRAPSAFTVNDGASDSAAIAVPDFLSLPSTKLPVTGFADTYTLDENTQLYVRGGDGSSVERQGRQCQRHAERVSGQRPGERYVDVEPRR